MAKQLLIAGFHRSGTSMLAQELYRAGLFLGKRLMEPNLYNVDGYFEDLTFVALHEKLLRYHQSGWQHNERAPLAVPEDYRREMDRILASRDNEYEERGFKDPRTLLFIDEWARRMSQPYTLATYRHYTETTRSLLHRAGGDLLTHPAKEQLRFWKEPELAYRMWIAYNCRLLSHLRAHPGRVLLLSHHAVLSGYPVVGQVRERFGFELGEESPSSVDPARLSKSAGLPPPPSPALQSELDRLWEELQESSAAPDPMHCGRRPLSSYRYDLPALEQAIGEIDGREERRDRIAETLAVIDDPDRSEDLRRRMVRDSGAYFDFVGRLELLTSRIESWTEKKIAERANWKTLGDLYRVARKEQEVHHCDMMDLAVSPQITPFHYHRLAEGYLLFSRFGEAEFFLDRALGMMPDHPAFYRLKARLEIERCRYEAAIDALEEASGLFDEKGKEAEALDTLLRLCDLYFDLEEEAKLETAKEEVRRYRERMKEVPAWLDRYMEKYRFTLPCRRRPHLDTPPESMWTARRFGSGHPAGKDVDTSSFLAGASVRFKLMDILTTLRPKKGLYEETIHEKRQRGAQTQSPG